MKPDYKTWKTGDLCCVGGGNNIRTWDTSDNLWNDHLWLSPGEQLVYMGSSFGMHTFFCKHGLIMVSKTYISSIEKTNEA